MNDHLSVYSCQHLAQHFDGKIAFRFADYYTDEKLRMTYEIYQPGKAFYIYEKGNYGIYKNVVSSSGTANKTGQNVNQRKELAFVGCPQ